MINIKIGNKEYSVIEAKSEEEKSKGLQGLESLPENEGMLFYFNNEDVSMTMKEVQFPIDIIFINDEQEVNHIHTGNPGDKDLITIPNTQFVLEVNSNSGIKIGDILEFIDESGPVMKVLFQDGTTQYELWGGERIVSRRETKILIKKAKKANESKEDKDYKALGKYIFKVFDRQDNRDPEYVQAPDSNK